MNLIFFNFIDKLWYWCILFYFIWIYD